jgi:EAL domain-containing protein (putative c-di-GMP-specific phosphodiesterase class I)
VTQATPVAPKARETAESKAARLAALAFASADLLFEIDEAGRVTFAIGAASLVVGSGERALLGASWRTFFSDEDGDLLDAVRLQVEPGRRQGPIMVQLRARQAGESSRTAALSVFRLPQAEFRLSCALTASPVGAPRASAPQSGGLLERAAFMAELDSLLATIETEGAPIQLDLVELEGLGQSLAKMSSAEAEVLQRKVAATLRARSARGAGASQLGPDRFALVRDPTAGADLGGRLEAISGGAFRASVAEINVEARAQGLKAMRYALDRFIEAGPTEAAQTFSAAVARTVRDANRFKRALAGGGFDLAYQPIMDLKRGGLHHFEALARFDAEASPAETIQLAEELGLICDFDLAVVRCVIEALSKTPAETKIAANISAVSIVRPGFVEQLLEASASKPKLRPRLLLEITETQALRDLAMAAKAVASLRSAGHPVCLDDFGAGAASLDYLRALHVDYVKMDGRYVKGLEPGARDAVLLRHLAALCRELGVTTIAEMVETREVADLVRDLGLDLGQGWWFGKPQAQPLWPPETPQRARRVGAVEQWG